MILANDLGYGDTGELRSMLEEISRMLEIYSRSMLSTGY